MTNTNDKIGNYRLIRLLGEGGMARVFEAEHVILGTRWAVKILNPEWGYKSQVRERFIREAKIMSQLKHENIVNIHDYFQEGNQYAIVMELLEGEDLSGFIKRQGFLSKELAYDLMLKILNAFGYAHAKGLVHRDVKPSNLFITKDKNIKILDFGIAKIGGAFDMELTQTGLQMGTPMYMSPEQVKDAKHIDKRTDIYSLGVILHYMLSGKPPYDSTKLSRIEILNKIISDPLPPLNKNKEFEDIIRKATAKEPEQRYQNCEAFLEALKGKTTSETKNKSQKANHKTENTGPKTTSVPPQTPSPPKTQSPPPPKKPLQNKNLLWGALALIFLILGGVYVVNRHQAASRAEEYALYSHVESENTQQAYKQYLHTYPYGVHSEEIRQNLQALQEQRRATAKKKEYALYSNVKRENTQQAYKQYLNTYPNGAHSEEIRQKLEALKKAEEERRLLRHLFDDQMIYVSGGTFEMGSNNGYDNEKPVHTVTVNSFYMGKYEVTQKQWKAIMGNNPSEFKGDNLPVENVSWNGVQEFIKKLNQKTGKHYRLPTEAEWEFTARGGNKSRGYEYSGSNDINEVAWYWDNAGRKNHFVGQKSPNELGIYDMSGNVWEWCQDWYDENYYRHSPQNNPQGPESGSLRVHRGGGWDYGAPRCRVADRGYWPGFGYDNLGFRIALPAP